MVFEGVFVVVRRVVLFVVVVETIFIIILVDAIVVAVIFSLFWLFLRDERKFFVKKRVHV